jgi:hypothetical protein
LVAIICHIKLIGTAYNYKQQMVKKVVLSDSNDSDQDDAPQMLTKAQASTQFKSQKLSIKQKAVKKVKP